MDTLKTLVVMGVMAAVGYGVYVSVWQKPEPSNSDTAPPYTAPTAPPTVQIPGLGSPTPPTPGEAPGSAINNPSALPGGNSASAFSANPPAASAPGGATTSAAANLAPPANPSGATLIAPPAEAGTANATQPSAPGAGPPTLLSSSASNQAPAATYPASPSVSASSTEATAPTGSFGSSSDGNFQSKFLALMDAVQKKLEEGRLAEAHLALSSLYDNPDLPAEQARQLTELLDRLAGTVIYSRKNLLEPPYFVQTGETLDQIAQKYNVPTTLLARINGIRDPQHLEPGRELKVVRGPFSAVIHLHKHELTLVVQGRYAGRFPIGVGCDQPKLEGAYTVREKSLYPEYHGPDGVTVAGGDPRNPLGKFWIGLSDKVGLHGTIDPQNIGRDDSRGAICLGDHDIDDLFGILSVGSRVVIQR